MTAKIEEAIKRLKSIQEVSRGSLPTELQERIGPSENTDEAQDPNSFSTEDFKALKKSAILCLEDRMRREKLEETGSITLKSKRTITILKKPDDPNKGEIIVLLEPKLKDASGERQKRFARGGSTAVDICWRIDVSPPVPWVGAKSHKPNGNKKLTAEESEQRKKTTEDEMANIDLLTKKLKAELECVSDPQKRERILDLLHSPIAATSRGSKGAEKVTLYSPKMTTLHELLLISRKDPAALDPNTRYRLALEIIDAVYWMHRAGFAHRDLKPENIFVYTGKDGQQHIKLFDFGTMCDAEKSPETGLLVTGSPACMPPKLATFFYKKLKKEDIPDYKPNEQDCWGLGIVLQELFAANNFSPILELKKYLIECKNELCIYNEKYYMELIQTTLDQKYVPIENKNMVDFIGYLLSQDDFLRTRDLNAAHEELGLPIPEKPTPSQKQPCNFSDGARNHYNSMPPPSGHNSPSDPKPHIFRNKMPERKTPPPAPGQKFREIDGDKPKRQPSSGPSHNP